MFTMVGVAILLAGMSSRLPTMLTMLVVNIKSQSRVSIELGSETEKWDLA